MTPSRILAALLVGGALAPAGAHAAPIELRGAATLRQTADREVRVAFVTPERLERASSGRPDARVVFSDQGRAGVRPAGRHARGYRYAAILSARRDLRPGARYRVRIEVPGGRSLSLRLKLIDAR